MPTKTAADKCREMLQLLEDQVLSESSMGANPMQVMLAAGVPMLKQALVDLERDDGVDAFLDGVIALAAGLRSDDAPSLAIVAGRAPRRLRTDELAASELGEPAGLEDLPDGVQQLREVDPGGLAAPAGT